MNIKEAKKAIELMVREYMTKDEYGDYVIPQHQQRPIFMVGAPGIGKTAIMEQIASDLDVGLVAYTMTHHTRQSACGFPTITEVSVNGKKVKVTEYTMSEIIAKVYQIIDTTGKKEGILFLDEINCLSETLAPAMLEFLQYKKFGNWQLPEGWVLVTAGNPPQFNKSVKEFDVATQDRLRIIDIDADFNVWKEYAINKGVHPAVIGFLSINGGWFYKITSSAAHGKQFATARGWEDLSTTIKSYEKLGFEVDEELISQFIKVPEAAQKFAVYYRLFKKYRMDYGIQDIIDGNIGDILITKAVSAKFDERLSIISMLTDAVTSLTSAYQQTFGALSLAARPLRKIKKQASGDFDVREAILSAKADIEREMAKKKEANSLSSAEKAIDSEATRFLSKYAEAAESSGKTADAIFKKVKAAFSKDSKKLAADGKTISHALDSCFKFVSQAWGDDQEMVLWVTQITTTVATMMFIAQNGCDEYYKYNGAIKISENKERENLINEISLFLDDDEKASGSASASA